MTNRILVFNEIDIERRIMTGIIEEGLPGVDVVAVKTFRQAIVQLQKTPTGLFVASSRRFDALFYQLVIEARRISPETPILVTSDGFEEDVSRHVWRMGAQNYLLKPYRSSWLLAAVKSMLQDVTVRFDVDHEEQRRHNYLQRISEHMKLFQYKKCTDDAREYLDLLHENADDGDEVWSNTVAFVDGIVSLSELLGSFAKKRVAKSLGRFNSRFDLQGRKYETYLILEKLINMIFEIMEEEKLRPANDMQMILNYIDRSVKQGITLEAVSEYANMSCAYFSKLFKKTMGENFITYVTDRKIEYAKMMLDDTELPIISIAYELSYNETSYFSKVFKKKAGLTPTEYRTKGIKKLESIEG